MFEKKSSSAGLVLGIIGTALAACTAISVAFILLKMKKDHDEALEEMINMEIDTEIEKALAESNIEE